MAVKNLNLPAFPPFNCSGEDTSVLFSSWKRYVKRFNLLCNSMVVTDDSQKRSLLLTLCGDETYEIYENISDQGDDETFDEVVAVFENHFKPQVNRSYETFLFRKMSQRMEETIQQYYVRLLEQSSKCEFNDKDMEIKQQIELSTINSKLRKYSFQNPTKTLSEILSIAKTFETMKIQTEEIEKRSENEADVNKISKRRNGNQRNSNRKPPTQRTNTHKQNKRSSTCYRCGGEFPHINKCPALGKTCSSCGKADHYSRVCRSKSRNMGRNQREGNYSKPLNTVEEETEPLNVVEKEDFEQHEHLFTTEKTEGKIQHQDFKTKVFIEKTNVELLIDTGASINILNEATYEKINKRLNNRLNLKRTRTKVVTYGNDSPELEIKGEINLLIESKEKFVFTKFYVIKTHHKNLLSGATATALKLISINNIEEKSTKMENTFEKKIPEHLKEKLARYKETVFSGKIGKLKDYQVKLKINENVNPIAQRERRLPFAIRQQVKEELAKLEDEGIIETVTNEATPWISPMVIVPKANGKIRLCIDMRGPNQAIERTRYPIPTLEDLTFKLKDSKVFTKLDLNSAFHQLELDKGSRPITTFQTENGIKRFTRLTFGVNSAQEELQHALRETIKDIDGTMNLIDDIIVHGKTHDEHDAALLKLIKRCEEKGITLNLQKCIFSQQSLKFFGFVFSEKGMHPDPQKLDEIKQIPEPEDVKALQSFLGLMNYFKRFIPKYSTLTHPLRKLLHKHETWSWTSECQSAFEKLRTSLTSKSCIAYYDPKKETTIYTDASPVGISAVIIQNTPNKDDHKLISYSSRALTPTEQRYSQIERECLAIVYACEHNKLYLFGTTFNMFSDHKPIVNLLNNPNSTVPLRIERMTLCLQGYKFDLQHVKGENNISDYPSRHPYSNAIEENNNEIEQYVNFVTKYACPNALSIEDIREETKKNPVLQIVADLVRHNSWYKLEQLHRHPHIKEYLQKITPYRNIKDQLTVNKESDLLLKLNRIVIPETLENTILQLAHVGHLGITKTKTLLRSKVYFPNIDEKTERLIKYCAACQIQTKPVQPAKLSITKTPTAVWETANIDYLGPLPNGYYLIVLIDQLSKFPIVEAIRNTSADLLIDFLQRTIATFGIPNTIISDNGPPFKSYKLRKFFNKLRIKHQRITPLWPQANSQAESFMKPLMKAVRTAYFERANWKKQLQNFLFTYRNAPHCTTKLSPASVMFQRETSFTIPSLKQKIEENANRKAWERQEEAKRQRKEYYDKKMNAKDHNINVGDTVILKKRKQNKLSTNYEPRQYKVTATNHNMITASDGQSTRTRNVSHFRPTHQLSFKREDPDEDVTDMPTTPVEDNQHTPTRRYPLRERRPVDRYDGLYYP